MAIKYINFYLWIEQQRMRPELGRFFAYVSSVTRQGTYIGQHGKKHYVIGFGGNCNTREQAKAFIEADNKAMLPLFERVANIYAQEINPEWIEPEKEPEKELGIEPSQPTEDLEVNIDDIYQQQLREVHKRLYG
jgi:hypothetical protein